MFERCPIFSRFIETREDAFAYYAFRLVGERPVTVRGVPLVVRFNPEEIHIFTDTRAPCPPPDIVRRAGRSSEVRCLCIERARAMDLILPTIEAPVAARRARMPGATMLFGPPDPASTRRLCTIVAPGGRVYFVRTSYLVNPTEFRQALKSNPIAAPWPPPMPK